MEIAAKLSPLGFDVFLSQGIISARPKEVDDIALAPILKSKTIVCKVSSRIAGNSILQ